jgi:uncharacterized protein YkwD
VAASLPLILVAACAGPASAPPASSPATRVASPTTHPAPSGTGSAQADPARLGSPDAGGRAERAPRASLAVTTAPADPSPSTPCGQDPRAELLQRLNALRAQGGQCGGAAMAPVPPLSWHPGLAGAARAHAQDMVRLRYFEHRDRQGRNVDARVAATGYPWAYVAENIAAGQGELAAAWRQWLASPGHCRNLLSPDARDVGLACERGAEAQMPTRWVLVLAARLQ